MFQKLAGEEVMPAQLGDHITTKWSVTTFLPF